MIEESPVLQTAGADWRVETDGVSLDPRSALEVLTNLNERVSEGKVGDLQPVATGFVPFDKAIGGGLRSGELMLIGGALGMAHVPLPYVEPAILASVVALGILVMLAIDLPVWAGALVIGAFAVFHGYAHGSEVAEALSGAQYMAGFAVATGSLHALGIGFALLMNRIHARALVRVAGFGCVLLGIGLFAEVL